MSTFMKRLPYRKRMVAYYLHRKSKSKDWIYTLDDKALEDEVARWFYAQTGVRINIAHPQTFNEKMQWLKVHDRDPRKATLSDKLAMRPEVAAITGEQALPQVYRTWDRAQDIDFTGLPERFIVKCNNGSDMMLRVTDASTIDMDEVRKKAKGWLRRDFAAEYFEMQYAEMEPRIFAEEWIDDIEWEYQAWVFNGKTQYVAAIQQPHGVNEKQFFSPDWEKLPFVSSQPEYQGVVERPDCLEQIIELSERLSEGFLFVRVDWYGTGHGLMFSETTFTPAFGNVRWDPAEYNLKAGQLLHLPIED